MPSINNRSLQDFTFFWGIDAAQKVYESLSVMLQMAGVLFLAGLAVGAIHGAILVRLAAPDKKIVPPKNG